MVSRRRVLAGALAAALGGCLGGGDGSGSPTATTSAQPTGSATDADRTETGDGPADATIDVTSSAFGDGESIPTKYTGEGEDVSPPLSIGTVPEGTRSLALVVDDPDAPDPPFTHWLVWAILPETRSIPADLPAARRLDALDGAIQGRNDFDELGYRGPLPPSDDGPHRYRFTVTALGTTVDLEPGSGREAVDDALAGEVLGAGRLVGTYAR